MAVGLTSCPTSFSLPVKMTPRKGKESNEGTSSRLFVIRRDNSKFVKISQAASMMTRFLVCQTSASTVIVFNGSSRLKTVGRRRNTFLLMGPFKGVPLADLTTHATPSATPLLIATFFLSRVLTFSLSLPC